MGNAEVKGFLSSNEDPSGYLQQFMNLEVLSHGQFLADRWITYNVEKNKEYQNFFDWSNVQRVQNPEQIGENIRLQENKEKLLVGKLPPMISPDLLNPTFFDDVQLPFSPSEVVDFKDLQNKKFLILYKFFYIMQKHRKQEQNPINSLRTAFKSELPKAAEVGIRSGVHLMISLLREAVKHNQQLSDDTLNFLLDLFVDVKPLSLWGTNQIDIVLDKSLHTVADYLEELISSEKTSPSSKCKALKVLFSLGLLRGSLPNLLSVVALLRKYNIEVDLTRELKLLKLERPNTKFDFEKKLKAHTKVFFTSAAGDAQPEKSPNVSMTTDGKYIYLHSEIEGLMKIGTGYGYTMFGKVYKHVKEYRLKERATLAFVLGKLYYRSSRIGPVPLIELDPDTLEETGNQVHYDSLAPNSIFGEMTNPEIEFPIQTAAEIEAKGNQELKSPDKVSSPTVKGKGGATETGAQNRSAALKRDLRLMRPAQRSPMFTDGRYVYIVSQWTVDSRGRGGGGDSDDEDEGENQEAKQARYGVDIYDPVLDFEHVRTVELFDPNLVEAKDSQKSRQKAALTTKALDQASFTTNGSELLVGCPSGTDESTEARYKYFSLADGKLRAVNVCKEPHHFTNVCYDSYNNVVWSLNDTKKSFDTLSCLNNGSVAEPVSFPEESEFYVAFDNRQIIDLASGGVGLQHQGEDTKTKEKDEKNKEEIQLLMSMGFHDEADEKEVEEIKLEASENTVTRSKATQLFILANIARLADGYASLKDMETTDVAQNIRKPYCIHLIKKVFRYLEEFIDHYSRNFFDVLESQMTEEVLYDQCSFLCTLRVLKYNLAALETYSESLKTLGLKVLNEKFPAKLQKFIWRILEMVPLEAGDYEDVRKAVYNESLSILQYALSIIFPDIGSILNLLKTHMKDLNKKLNRDITTSVLFWLKSKDHIAKLVSQILQSSEQSSPFIKEIKELVNEVISWEVQKFNAYLRGVTEWDKFPAYQPDELISTSMSFVIEFQKEILFQLGQKVQEKSTEHTAIHQTNSDLTEALSKNGILINFELQNTLSRLGQKIIEYFDQAEKSGKLDEVEADKKTPSALLKYKNKSKKKKSKDELILDAYQDLWEQICGIYTEKIHFSQLLSFQLNTLALLSSNFIIAARTLKNITFFLTSLNGLYDVRKKFNQDARESLATATMERQLVFESVHPPPRESGKKEKITIPGAKELKVVFDPQCDLRQHHEWVQFFRDEHMRQFITQRLDRPESWPKNELIIKGDSFWFYFQRNQFSDAPNWGYKFTVSASFKESQEGDWLTSLHRTTCWLAGKCAGQLINGSALQQAMLQDEEQKYNSLLTSKLFSGGMEKCYFTGGKEGIWVQLGDIINDFEAGHLSDYLSGEMTEVEREEEEFLLSIIYPKRDVQMDKTIEFIQKLFSKEALWANLGGENGIRCVRAAYSVIIKHAGLINDLKEAMIEVELWDEATGKPSPNLKNLVKKWASASRMRQWLVEKRKDIDDREEKLKQMTQATQKQVKPTTGAKRKGGKGGVEDKKEETKEETIQTETKDDDPISQGGMQVRDSEEIIQRMIDQIVKKAEFLCQLIPSKHWSQDRTEKKEKQLLFRAASKKDDEVNKEEEWKRRLHQWKSVRQAKQVYKSLEDESQEIQVTLNTSVLLTLQSAVSIKRLRKQVESAYLRAICRTIGLNALTSILTGVKSSLFRQDVVGWLCTSLRGNENKIYHFTDNLQGCGHFLESAVNTAFKNVIVAIIKSMSKSNETEEVNCMLEALKWKYHGDDHMFLSEIDLFGVLRGQEPQQLLRKAWGQSLDTEAPGRVDPKLVKNLIKLFETVVILCVGKLNWSGPEQKAVASKKDKIPSLERHVSAVDEYSVEILIRQAFQVLFAELEDADSNYSKYSGVDWRIYNRVKAINEHELVKNEKRKQKQAKKKTEPATTAPTGGLFQPAFGFGSAQPAYNEDEDEDYDGQAPSTGFGFPPPTNPGSARPAQRTQPKPEKKETYSDEELDPEEEQWLKEIQEEEKTGIEPEEESKDEAKKKKAKEEEESKEKDEKASEENQADDDEERALRKQRRKLYTSLVDREKRILKEMQSRLYSPDFLYKLIALIYKCVTMGSDNVSVVIGNPKYISVLFSLLRHSPSSHQMLITKTIEALFLTLPHELFTDSISELQTKIALQEKESGSMQVVRYFLSVLVDVRRKVFEHAHESQGAFSVSCEVVSLIRQLLSSPNWGKYVESWITDSVKSNDALMKQIAFAVLGGDLNGLRIGGKMMISTNNRDEIFADNILLKQDLVSQPDVATIVGFTVEYVEKLNEEETKKRAKAKPADKEKWKIRMDIGSTTSNLNPLALIHSTISKEVNNFSTIELAAVNRFNCFAIDSYPFQPETYDLSKNPSVLLPVYTWAASDKVPKDTSNLYLRTLAIKSFNTYTKTQENAFLLSSKHKDLVESILNLATSSVVSSQLMNLELTEEKLFRLLQASCEKGLTLNDLPSLCATVKNKELEILLGKDLSTMKFNIQGGFNLHTVKKHYELMRLENPEELLKRKDLPTFIADRAVMVESQDIQRYPEIILNAAMVITYNHDMQKFADYYDQVFTQKKGGEETKENGEETISLTKEEIPSKDKAKFPKCLINISERAFFNLRKEFELQSKKDYKDVFENKDMLGELIEYGFPKETVEKYLLEHPGHSFDVVVNEIVKIIETEEAAKKAKNKKPDEGPHGPGTGGGFRAAPGTGFPGFRPAQSGGFGGLGGGGFGFPAAPTQGFGGGGFGFGAPTQGFGQLPAFGLPATTALSKGKANEEGKDEDEEAKNEKELGPVDPEKEMEKEKEKKLKMLKGELGGEDPVVKKIAENATQMPTMIGFGGPQIGEIKAEPFKVAEETKEESPVKLVGSGEKEEASEPIKKIAEQAATIEPQQTGFFGPKATTSSPFGFGQAQPATGFGVQAQPAFGFGAQTQPSTGFGVQAKPAFGFGAQPQAQPFGFGGPAGDSNQQAPVKKEESGDGEDGKKPKQAAEQEEQIIFDSDDEDANGPQDDFDIEKEDPNPCFKCQGEKELQNVSEQRNRKYDDLIAFESMNQIGKLILFKQLNYSLTILYARRILLNLVEKWSDDIPMYFITDSKYHAKFIAFLKLVVNEAMLSSGTFCNNNLILHVQKILNALFAKEAGNPEVAKFIDVLLAESVFKPLEELEKNYVTKPAAGAKKAAKTEKKDDKNALTVKSYSGRELPEFEIDRPSLEYSILIAGFFLNSDKESVSKRVLRFDILYKLFGLIPVIKNNRSLLWGTQVFALNMIDRFISNVSQIDLKAPENLPHLLLSHQHVITLHEYFYKLKQREKEDSFSRRTQILSEILINLNRLRRAVTSVDSNAIVPAGSSGGKIDVQKYKNIENLADVVDIMQTYPEHKSLLATTWLQVSSELIKNEQKVIDGDHFYYKNLHTYKIEMPFASEVSLKFSEDCQTDTGDSIMLSSDPHGEVSAEKISGNLAKKTVSYSAGSFYFHFPTKGADVVGLGLNDTYNYYSDSSVSGPLCIEDFNFWNTQYVDGSDSHTWILNKQGELFSSGTGPQTGLTGSSSKAFTQVKTKERVKLISCGSNFGIYVTENNEAYGVGNNQDGRLGLQWNQGGSTPTLIDITKKIIKEVSCGFNHTLICTIDGALFSTGNNEFGQLGQSEDGGSKIFGMNTFRQVTLKDSKVISVAAGQGFSLILTREKGKNLVYSCGDKTGGKLGLGNDVTPTVNTFTVIPALENMSVVSISAKRKHAVAVTYSGKIYSWGVNDYGQLGHGDFENQVVPRRMEFFKDTEVVHAATGATHTLVIAKNKQTGVSHIYAMGNNSNHRLGLKKMGEKVPFPTPIEFFDDKKPAKVYSGTNHALVVTEPMQIAKVRDVHHFPCHLTKKEEIVDAMYVDLLDGNKTYTATEAEKANAGSDLMLLVKEALSLKEIHWPNVPNDFFEDVKPSPEVDFKAKCSVTGKPIKGVCYINLFEPQEVLCHEAAHAIPVNHVSPSLYYRLRRPLKSGKTLPVMSRTQFYAQSETYGYNITITPQYNEKGHDYMMNKYKESFDAFSADMKNLKPEADEQLVDLINNLTQKLEKSVFDLSENITFPKEEVSLRSAIEKASNDFLKKRFLILKAFNTKFKGLLPYIDFSAKKDSTRLRNIYSNASVYIFWDVKSELFEKLLAIDAKPATNVKVKVNRMKASKFIGKGKPDHTGEFTVFGQIYQYFKTVGFNCFKIAKDQNPFNVGFVGEASIDAGGPYREAVSQMCTELQSGALPLLIPSPNQKNDSGQFREKWVLNPSANTLIHTKMYEFLGALMGCSIRSKNFLNLDLPSIVWKMLVDVPANRKDLEHIDRYLIQCLDDVINIHKKGVDENSFSDIIQEKFVTTLSDGSEVELIPGGSKTLVT